MKGTATIVATLLAKAASERVTVEDDMVQLQSRSMKMGTQEVSNFLEAVTASKMEPAELLSNEIAVAQLAEAVDSSTQKLDDKTKKRLHEFKKFVMEVEHDIRHAHAEDQAKLDDSHGAKYGKCMKAYTKGKLDNAVLKTQWTTTEQTHLKCRKDQAELAAAMQTACGDLVAFQKLLRSSSYMAPTTSGWLKKPTDECNSVDAPDTDTFEAYFDKIIESKKSWKLRSAACAKASKAVVDKNSECEDIQENFESDFCSWRNSAYHNCYDMTQCSGDKVLKWSGDKEAALKRAEERKVHWQSAKHVLCFLDVMLHSNSTIAGCKGSFDSSAFDLIIPDKKMTVDQCELPGLGSYPGSGGWRRRYKDAECRAAKSHKCEALPDHILKEIGNSEEVTYVRWGHTKCPDGSELLFSGFVGGDSHGHRGSGANALCINPKPTFPPGNSNGNQNGALIYGTEYENTGAADKNHDKDAVCAMCTIRGATFTQWGRNECPQGIRQEYKGLIMATHHGHQKGQYVCVDEERSFRENSASNHNGMLWYTTEFQTGSLPSAVYKNDHEASCAQCTMEDYVSTYVRWGKRECPDSAETVFTGYAAGELYTHRGGSAMSICLHPDPNYPPGYSAGNQNGALIYGTEYENTGAVDKNHDKDVVCSLCAVRGDTHTQWGRASSCPENYILEYKGIVMAGHHGHHRTSWVCVDEAREYTAKSSNSNHNGALWYTTEYEQGSLPNNIYKHDHEVSCAQCTADDGTTTYVRWGAKKCAEHATTLYMGYAAGGHNGHRGSGYQTLCLHPEPTYPPGTHSGNQNGALIYGTEYQNTGAIDKNHDKDAVCAMCAVSGNTFVQWGRDICPEEHRTEYKGVVMANHYSQQPSEYVCVDLERDYMTNGQEGNHDGNLWYTTEFQTGSLPSDVFKADSEVSCAVCSTTPMGVKFR